LYGFLVYFSHIFREYTLYFYVKILRIVGDTIAFVSTLSVSVTAFTIVMIPAVLLIGNEQIKNQIKEIAILVSA